jgi:DNA/RNA endonuclease YhcR with UshA esterase domain
VAKGDRVRAVGEVSEYQGSREISVKRSADVEVLI